MENNSNHCIPSQFAAFCAVEANDLGISQVIEIASGDGRDSLFFANLGFEVMSLEVSSAAIAIIKARSLGLDSLKTFQIDVTNTKLPKPSVPYESCCYYSRFFIHTLAETKLREFFEVDANNIARVAVYSLFRKGDLSKKEISAFYKKLKVDASKPHPWEV